MISLQIIAIIIVTHYLADFALQTPYQAENKWYRFNALFYHVLNYSLVWLFISFGILGTLWKPLIFAGVTFLCHFITDMITSTITHDLVEKKDYHNMFAMIGGDQILHYTQLFLTYYVLS